MIGRRLRSTRGRVAVMTLVTFSLIGLILLAILDRSGLIFRVQDFRERDLISQEEARLLDEIAATGTATARDGQVRTIIVPAGSVLGFESFDFEVVADILPASVDISPSGLDPALFESTVVFFPQLSQAGWTVIRGSNASSPQPIGPEQSIALLAVTDDAVIGPLSVYETLLASIPIGSITLAGLFALVAGSGLRPVRRMTLEAGSIEIGDLDHRLPDPQTGDELDDLAATLNGMLDRVRQGVVTERRFVADAAHELRSPIAASTALLEVSLSTGDLDWRTTAESVLDEQRRLGALVDDLVLLKRLDDAGPNLTERIMFDDIVVTETSRPFRSDIEVVTIEPTAVDADRRSLERVVRNLLSNADRHATRRLEIHLRSTATHAVLVIDDDGPGIPVEQRTRVFDRFARLDDARSRDAGGSGIGLSIVKQVTEAHGGSVAISDSPMDGARFTVMLPIASPTAPSGSWPNRRPDSELK